MSKEKGNLKIPLF